MNHLAKKSNLIFLIGVRQPHPYISTVLGKVWSQSSQDTFYRKMKALRGCILERLLQTEFPKWHIDNRSQLILKHAIRDLRRLSCNRIYSEIGFKLCEKIGCGQGYQLENVCRYCDSKENCVTNHQDVIEKLIRYILEILIKHVAPKDEWDTDLDGSLHYTIDDFINLTHVNYKWEDIDEAIGATSGLQGFLESHTTFGMFSYTPIEYTKLLIFDAIYTDPIISKMNSKQCNRIFFWVPDEKVLLVARYKDRAYVMNEIDSYALDKLLDKFGSQLSWSVVRLENLLKDIPISQWYVDVDRDSDFDDDISKDSDSNSENDNSKDKLTTWVSLVEIGNNDDYQP